MSSDKPHRMQVKVLDGKPRERNKLKGQLVPHVDVIDARERVEFVICAVKEAHLDQVRAKLSAAGLEEIPGGATNVAPSSAVAVNAQSNQHGGNFKSSGAAKLKPKPYGFVPLPNNLTAAAPIWHDGTGAEGQLSGEIRCELVTLTPLLVGWERRQIDDTEQPWAVPHQALLDNVVDVTIPGVGRTIKTKSILCPLRVPWGERPVLLPGDSLKGLLRHEIGALLGAPMERVAERSYSYRPNSLFPRDPNPYLVARLARIPEDGIEMKPLDPDSARRPNVRVPTKLDLLPLNLKFDKNDTLRPPRYQFDVPNAATYRGGQGAGQKLNSKHRLNQKLKADPDDSTDSVNVPGPAQDGYLHTLRHLTDLTHGHFSERHPDVPTIVAGDVAQNRILTAAANEVFAPGDMIWVEWDTRKKCIVSLGWHYYYRWAYVDTVRKKGWSSDRFGLFPLTKERETDETDAPKALSPVRRLFGYTGDSEGSQGIGREDHEQLMGRISINAAIEVVADGETADDRFLPPTFLRELGMPRPSAVEHYLGQPYYPEERPSDCASLVTYGDAEGYDEPGRLAGRKFYLDREDAYTGEPWKDDSEENRLNDRSTLALEASRPGRRFRFTIRFRDLDPAELAAMIVALCPHQFRELLGGMHMYGYCSKLGYARPLGWGSVRIEAKALLMLNTSGDEPALEEVTDLSAWMPDNYTPSPMLLQWLTIHQHKHQEAADYPRGDDGQIYTYHTKLRAEHTRARRYKRSDR